MKLPVQSIKHVLRQETDIDPTAAWDVRTVDALGSSIARTVRARATFASNRGLGHIRSRGSW